MRIGSHRAQAYETSLPSAWVTRGSVKVLIVALCPDFMGSSVGSMGKSSFSAINALRNLR